MLVEGFSQSLGISGGDEKTGVEALQGVGEPADTTGDNGSTGGQRLQHHQPESLQGERRNDREVRRPVKRRQ